MPKYKQFFFYIKALLQSLILFTIFVFLIIFIYRSFGTLPENSAQHKKVVTESLNFLKHSLRENNGAQKMQELFPEGSCFTITLYGLAWTNISRKFPGDNNLRTKALEESIWAFNQYNKPYVNDVFQDTQVENGVFWLGQKNLLLGQILEIIPIDDRPVKYVKEFHNNSKNLTEAFLKSPTHHLDSYPYLCWTADNVTALKSLFIHDKLYNSNYKKAYFAWKKWTQNNLDPDSGMFAGHLISQTGELLQPSRGCANSWILSLLPDMDPEFARKQYKQYRKKFMINRLGFNMLREYPKGIDKPADVDSGPIIWGAGVTATGVGLGASFANGDMETASDINNLSNTLGFPDYYEVNGENRKKYLYGFLPVGDGFLTWGYTLQNLEDELPEQSLFSLIKKRVTFYLLLIFLLSLVFIRAVFLYHSLKKEWKIIKNQV